jgi:hypothetical protein
VRLIEKRTLNLRPGTNRSWKRLLKRSNTWRHQSRCSSGRRRSKEHADIWPGHMRGCSSAIHALHRQALLLPFYTVVGA